MLNAAQIEVAEYGDGIINATTGELIPIQEAPLPAVYERAAQALAECTRIDECQDWADKAEALASYARQSKDDSLRKMADRIQARAIRRCGELLREQEAANKIDRDCWIAQARASFVPSERKPCVVCGRFQSISQAHHVFPLAIQWRFGIQRPIHDHEWLCPNHHVSIHILISQSQASSLDASATCINVTSDLALNLSEFNKVLSLLERFHSYPKGERDGTR